MVNESRKFSKKNMVNTVPEQYLHHVVNDEIPWGFEKYLEVELFP
jgi:hypothetical protein